jgi:hypothetical protein
MTPATEKNKPLELATRRLGTALIAVGVILGGIFWVQSFLDPTHLHNPMLVHAAVWIGGPGLVLFIGYWVLKFFGFTK